MYTWSSQQQEAQSPPLPIIEMSAIAAEVISPASDELPWVVFIRNPQDSVPYNIFEEMLGRICIKHGLSRDDALLPGEEGPHSPPKGYTAFNRFSCTAGTLSLFNQYIREVLSYLRIAPSQMHLNDMLRWTAYLLSSRSIFIDPQL